MIARRGLLVGGATMAATIRGVAATAPPDLRFDVLRNDSDIGHHSISFHADGDILVANIAVEIVVRFGPIPVFRYNMTALETWRGDRFLSLVSETDDDGKHFRVRATTADNQVIVQAEGTPRVVLAPGTIPLTHWNRLCMERPLFNPQDGVAIASTVVARGEEMVPLADDKMVRAEHFSLVGKVNLEDWYDTAQRWAALRSAGTDGSRIDYRRAA
jgi:hypothetical protein